jgi:Flp pilus assembly protein TadD
VRVADLLLVALPELVRGERLHLIRGCLAFDACRFVEAAAEYRQAVAAKPESVPARINLGSALTQLGEVQNAINEFQAALRYAPENTVAHYNLGVSLVRQNQPESASLTLFLHLLGRSPASPDPAWRWAKPPSFRISISGMLGQRRTNG